MKTNKQAEERCNKFVTLPTLFVTNDRERKKEKVYNQKCPTQVETVSTHTYRDYKTRRNNENVFCQVHIKHENEEHPEGELILILKTY